MAKRAEVSRSSALSSLCGVGGPARHNGLLIFVTNKSHDVTIETPTNHISSRRDIVFRSVENHVGIGCRFIISKKGSSFQITSKLRRNHDLYDCARMEFLLIRLCPRPPTLIPFEAETLSFVHVLLVFGVILVSLLTKIC
jgi:hypothetical protein